MGICEDLCRSWSLHTGNNESGKFNLSRIKNSSSFEEDNFRNPISLSYLPEYFCIAYIHFGVCFLFEL